MCAGSNWHIWFTGSNIIQYVLCNVSADKPQAGSMSLKQTVTSRSPSSKHWIYSAPLKWSKLSFQCHSPTQQDSCVKRITKQYIILWSVNIIILFHTSVTIIICYNKRKQLRVSKLFALPQLYIDWAQRASNYNHYMWSRPLHLIYINP